MPVDSISPESVETLTNPEQVMSTDLTVSELDLNNIVEQPREAHQVESVNYEDTVIVSPQEPNDDLIALAITNDELPDTILKHVMLGMAEEAQAVKSYRRAKSKENKDVSNISLRLSTILKHLSETEIQNQALKGGTGDLDLKSPKFREIIKMFLGIIADTFEEVKIPPEYKSMFFSTMQRNLEGWEIRAEKILKKMPGVFK
jgi:hypothetical protein